MYRLELILIFMLQGISGENIVVYNRPGQDAVLPCRTESSSSLPTCSSVMWLYNRRPGQLFFEVVKGKVFQTSPRAARLSVDTDCSLIINKVTDEDVGLYTCSVGQDTGLDVSVYLSILTISPSSPGRGGEVNLECSLLKYTDLKLDQDYIRWADETGAVLPGRDVGNLVSVMTVKRQSGNNRRYTCLLLKDNVVMTEASYTPDFPEVQTDCKGRSPLSIFMFHLNIARLVMMIVLLVLIIKNRWKKKALDNDNNGNNDTQYDDVGAPPAAAAQLQ
ncbi:uncharacterized protein LOC131990736 [Centropristis striata]|uniref:uncharacterized protein LOC131990736 n=1 Tax=Centropristis striata TaxID=184440 RepID=UPI0027E0ACFA|nr:uncharacterized protein LOC131990736 [Centropristis striata]